MKNFKLFALGNIIAGIAAIFIVVCIMGLTMHPSVTCVHITMQALEVSLFYTLAAMIVYIVTSLCIMARSK